MWGWTLTTYSMTKRSTMNHVHIVGWILRKVPVNVCSVSGECKMTQEGICWDDLKNCRHVSVFLFSKNKMLSERWIWCFYRICSSAAGKFCLKTLRYDFILTLCACLKQKVQEYCSWAGLIVDIISLKSETEPKAFCVQESLNFRNFLWLRHWISDLLLHAFV